MPRAYIRASKVRPSVRYRRPGPDVMRHLGQEIATKILTRTLSGLDEDNRPFEPYAEDGPKAGEIVTLTESGDMLSGFGVTKVGPTTVTLGWQNQKLRQRAAFQQQGTRYLPARPFVGVPLAWVRQILQRLWRPIR